MNAVNRLVMLILALLLIAVPVLVFLVAFNVLPANEVNAFTNYRGALQTLERFSVSGFTGGERLLVAVIGVLLALAALLLLLTELSFGRRVARRAYLDSTSGRETTVTAGAVRHLAEGAAREVGAASPSCRLSTRQNQYEVACDIEIPDAQDFAGFAARVRENIRRVLEEQRVPTRDVEITVQGTASQE